MKGLYFDGKNLFLRKDLPLPRAGPGEALIRVTMAGICSTDLEITRGYMDFRGVPGHEFTGVVEDAGSPGMAGRRVVGEINAPCNECSTCREGLGKHCPHRRVLGISAMNGVFAEYTVLPEENIHPIPGKLDDREAVFTEPLAAACEITSRFDIGEYQRIAVLGDGRLASLVAQVLKLNNSNITIVGRNSSKMERIRKMGFETAPSREAGRMRETFDLIVECTGSTRGLPLAVELIKPRGLIILKSTYHDKMHWNPSPVAVNEITITGSRCGPFPPALELLRRGRVEVIPLISGLFPLNQWMEAFDMATHGGSFKVLLDISSRDKL